MQEMDRKGSEVEKRSDSERNYSNLVEEGEERRVGMILMWYIFFCWFELRFKAKYDMSGNSYKLIKGWKKSLSQVMVVMQVHEKSIVVGFAYIKALSEPSLSPLHICPLPSHPPDVTKKKVAAFRQSAHVHAVFAGIFGRQRGCWVTWGHDILDLGLSLREVSREIHLLPAILFLSINARETKSFQWASSQKVKGAIWLLCWLLAGLW